MSRYVFQLELGEDSLGITKASSQADRWLDLGDISESFFLIGLLPLLYTEALSSRIICKDLHAAYLIASIFNTSQSKYIIFPVEDTTSTGYLSSISHQLYNAYCCNPNFYWSKEYVTLSSVGMDPNE